MKPILFVICLSLSISVVSVAGAVTLTFDDVPSSFQNLPPECVLGAYYSSLYGIGFDRGFYSADRTGSSWGPPRSGSKVLAYTFAGVSNTYGMMFKKDQPLDAYLVGAYFSTEPGVVLEMIGYYQSLNNPVASTLIGAPGESWNNVYVQISSPTGINEVEFRPVTTDALSHFCADDITVAFVPEPTSLLALGAGGFGLLGAALRRRIRARA